jgi:hypothetical protein
MVTWTPTKRRTRCQRQCWTCLRLLPDELFTHGFILDSRGLRWGVSAAEEQLRFNEEHYGLVQREAARKNSESHVFTEEEDEMMSREWVPCAGPGCNRLFDRGDPMVVELTSKGATPPCAHVGSLAQTVKIIRDRERTATPPSAEVAALMQAKSDELFCLVPGCCKLIPEDWFKAARLIWQVDLVRSHVRIDLETKLLSAEWQRANADTAGEEEEDEEDEEDEEAGSSEPERVSSTLRLKSLCGRIGEKTRRRRGDAQRAKSYRVAAE